MVRGRRENLALLLLLLVFLSTLTLGYMSSPSGAGGNRTKNIITSLSETLRGGDTGNRSAHSGSGYMTTFGDTVIGRGSPEEGLGYRPPTSNFSFRESDVHVKCPVAILPKDPMLVCVKTPARSVPLIKWNLPSDFRMIAWFNGTYYLLLVSTPAGPVPIGGVAGRPVYSLRTSRPLVLMTYNSSVSFTVTTNFTGNITVYSGLPVRIENVSGNGSALVYTLSIPPLGKNYTPGYYPVFITAGNDTGTVALLMWVALLDRPVVRILGSPSELSGNGRLTMRVWGEVRYTNGSPVRDGLVTVTLNRTKNSTGVVVGIVRLHDGVFNLTAYVPSNEPPGEYHVVAHYRGYLAYPSNSDPVVFIRRKPEVSVKPANGTLRVYLHWGNVSLPNATITVVVGNETFRLRTGDEGYAYLPLTGNVSEVRVYYPGSRYYTPLNETIEVKRNVEAGTNSTATRVELPEKKTFRVPGRLVLMTIGAGVGALGGVLYLRRKRTFESLHNETSLKKPVRILEPARRVFLPGERVRFLLSDEVEAFLDGNPLGFGREFQIEVTPGRHVLSAGGAEFEFLCLPPREAVIEAYSRHFLPFALSKGVPVENLTPYELEHLLTRRSLDRTLLRKVTEAFVLAEYGGRPFGERDFMEFVEAMERLGVFGNGE
ncbi:DUF4129 domain-containing protein [Thermococcus sp.]|uniref:DUF4129 domain-containing protein n=1 Tax=Thermococcus sp. TaxID=35749 RepID=UPI002607FFE4|nr:DUF4129 domain-containing protein [Thermococcus sp.]